MKPVLEIKNLSFAYDKQRVLENINLNIYEKDFLAIIGQNGGGKSTLLKLILGINRAEKGEILIFGKNPKETIQNLGYVPQNTNVNINFPIKVFEVVLMGNLDKKRTLFGYSKEEKEKAYTILKKVGMEKFANSKIGDLSGGQRQRVFIARALCSNPKILLLDEPTSNIDVKGQREIYNLLKELNREITIVVVSHDISIILGYANRVAHINRVLTIHEVPKSAKIDTSSHKHFCEIELLEMMGGDK